MNRAVLLMAAPLLWAMTPSISANAQSPAQLDAGSRLIIVEPVPEEFSLQASLNRGGSNPQYRVGEPIQIRVRATQDAYIYLFSVEADGRIQLILPNRFTGAPYLQASQTQTFPSPGSPFRFTVSPPYGQSQVLVVASKGKLSARDLAYFRSGYGVAPQQTLQSKSSDSSSLAIVVEPTEQPWVARSLYYQVR